MRKVLLYSGGFDSTLVLARMFQDAREDDEICAISIVHSLTGMSKHRREYESQILCVRALQEHYPHVNFQHEIIRVESEWSIGSCSNSRGLAQPILWLCNIIPLLSSGDEVHLGYIHNDDAALVEGKIRELWKAALRIQNDKNIELVFPIKYLHKEDVVRELIQNFDYLFNYCVSCEDIDYNGTRVCGKCIPCGHLKNALLMCCVHYDDYVSNRAREALRTLFNIEFELKTQTDEHVSVEEVFDDEENYNTRECSDE